MTRTLAEQLEQRLREADFWRPLGRSRVECFAGGRRCTTWPRFAGVCKVLYSRGRKLYLRCGHVNGLSCDPIENKPPYRSLLGTRALSFGTLGCDLNCGYCRDRVRVGQVRQNTPLRHVPAGKARGRTRDRENTFGPGCRPSVSERRGFREQRNRVSAQGECPDCGEAAGVWGMPGRNRDETADWLHIRCG
jgi:hypothetical protein